MIIVVNDVLPRLRGLRAFDKSFTHWRVHVPQTLSHDCVIESEVPAPQLHLATAIRSFRAERLSDFVGQVIYGNASAAASLKRQLRNYLLQPLV